MTETSLARPRRRTTISSMNTTELPEVESKLAPAVKRELDQLVIDAYELNQAANAAKTAYDKTRAKLLKRMQELDMSDHTVPFKKGTNIITVDATVGQAESTTIDIQKLYKQVDIAKFLEIVNASVSSVKAVAGSNIANVCSTPVKGNINVSVKE